MDSNLNELHDLGTKLFEEGKYSEAEPVLKDIITTNPKYADVLNPAYGQAWVQLGLTYYAKGLTALAFEEWESALKQNPDLKEAKTYIQLLKKKDSPEAK